MVAHLDTIVQQVSVDIGFGDVVTPYPLLLDYPRLLPDVPAVELSLLSLCPFYRMRNLRLIVDKLVV